MYIRHVMLRIGPVLCNGEGPSVDGLTTYDGGQLEDECGGGRCAGRVHI